MKTTTDPKNENHIGVMVKQVFELDADIIQMIIENNRLLKLMEKQITNEQWLTTEEAAKHIKKSVTHLRGRLKDEIGYSQPGSELLFRREDLERYLMKHYHSGRE